MRSSIANRLGLDAGGLPAPDRNVDGVVEMTLDATRNYTAPLTEERLFSWHAALFPTGRSRMRRISRRPMARRRRRADGSRLRPDRPPARFTIPLRRPSASGTRYPGSWNGSKTHDPWNPYSPPGVAHLWFVTIHPFEDGNGRIARAIADMALARSEESPERFYSMSAQIRLERNAYYGILETTQKGGLDITDWQVWFLECLARAIGSARQTLAAVLAKASFWEAHASALLNERQVKIINRLLDGFEGKLTSSKWGHDEPLFSRHGESRHPRSDRSWHPRP